MKVLVADDAKMMRTIVRRTLESLGVDNIVEAEDGAQAIGSFVAGEYDLVITDWNMPHKSGLEVIQVIRETDKQVPIMMITTEGQKTSVLQAVKAGVSDYILKPFQAPDLKVKIEKHLPSLA